MFGLGVPDCFNVICQRATAFPLIYRWDASEKFLPVGVDIIRDIVDTEEVESWVKEMKIKTVVATEKHQYGVRAVWGEIEISKVRAYRFHGCGSATIQYEGLGSDGKWYRFLKKDQLSSIKSQLPVIASFPNRFNIVDESRPYTIQYRLESNLYSV